MIILYLTLGLAIGGTLGFLFSQNSTRKKFVPISELDNSNSKLNVCKNSFMKLEIEFAKIQTELNNKNDLYIIQNKQLEVLNQEKNQFISEISTYKTRTVHLEKQLTEQKQDLIEVQKQFTEKFKLIAQEAIENQAKKQLEIGEKRIEEILKPLNSDLKNFNESVNNTYIKSTQERASLKEEIKQLTALNSAMREDAKRLTNALTKDTKQQGNWGELILEKILEKSGLEKNREYSIQVSTSTIEGGKIQPDVVINLPENKHLIIDSKVSLTAYNQLINCENEDDRKKYLKAHLDSVKQHVNSLSEKGYHLGDHFNSPDFVLLFMPIESSFSIATQADDNLFNFAWSKNIVIVSPSTLLATLKTIASLWKHEYQNQNVLEIARLAGSMHDKFFGFIKDMEDIGNRIRQTDDSYHKAMNKLQHGNGNLLITAQKVKDLGAKTKKDLTPKITRNND